MNVLHNWKSPDQELLPEFIIGGAMKSGTSTLHRILERHPRIFIPNNEIHFFDIDNILAHSDFNSFDRKDLTWKSQSMEKDAKKMWDWYLSKFQGKKDFIKGEDSTTYLESSIAAKRLALQDKQIKLIFILRHPVDRAYSNYWHLLRSGRAMFDFEDTLRYNPCSVLNRSLYMDQLRSYYDYFPRERIKIILFEDLKRFPKETIKGVSKYLNIDFNEFPEKAFGTHYNRSARPKSVKLQILKNRYFRAWGNSHYKNNLPYSLMGDDKSIFKFAGNFLHKVYSRLNSSSEFEIPQINNDSRQLLNDYFHRELTGIDDLTGEDIFNRWFDTKGIS